MAKAYEDFLDVLICDTRDPGQPKLCAKTGVRVHCAQTIMRTPEDKAELARKALALVSASPASDQSAAGQTSLDQTSSDRSFSDKAASDTAPAENASSE